MSDDVGSGSETVPSEAANDNEVAGLEDSRGDVVVAELTVALTALFVANGE